MLIFTQLQSWAARCLSGGHSLFEMIVVEISVFCLQAQGLLFLTIPGPMLALFIDSQYDATCTSSSAGWLTSSQLRWRCSHCHLVIEVKPFTTYCHLETAKLIGKILYLQDTGKGEPPGWSHHRWS